MAARVPQGVGPIGGSILCSRIGASLCAVILVLACQPVSPSGPGPRLTVTDGTASIETRGSKSSPVQGERVVGAGAKLNTGDQGIATLTSPDGSRIELLPRTELILDELAEGELSAVTLLMGRASISVTRPDDRTGLQISTEASAIALRTAHVFMGVEKSGLTEVEILEGRAEVTGAGKTLAGEAGQVVVVSPGLQPYRADPLTRRPLAQSPLARPLPLSVGEVKYGVLSISTAPNARCFGRLGFPRPQFGDMPGTSLTGHADATGVLRWTYPTPRLAAGTGSYAVTCVGQGGTGDVTGWFQVELRPILASDLSVRIVASDAEPGGERANVIQGLISLRDRAIAELRSTLASEWRTATRGLGQLEVVDSGEDITISVIAATGQSVHLTADDGTEAVVIYVADAHGPESPENIVAVALHELGHIWCCEGAGTTEGHWAVAQPDPRLTGLDRFGLMNHPVTCLVLNTGLVSCPNRFSERELRAMGFQNIPPP